MTIKYIAFVAMSENLSMRTSDCLAGLPLVPAGVWFVSRCCALCLEEVREFWREARENPSMNAFLNLSSILGLSLASSALDALRTVSLRVFCLSLRWFTFLQ